MPVFAEMVMSNEITIKENMRLIFLDLSESFMNLDEEKNVRDDKNLGDSSGGEF